MCPVPKEAHQPQGLSAGWAKVCLGQFRSCIGRALLTAYIRLLTSKKRKARLSTDTSCHLSKQGQVHLAAGATHLLAMRLLPPPRLHRVPSALEPTA